MRSDLPARHARRARRAKPLLADTQPADCRHNAGRSPAGLPLRLDCGMGIVRSGPRSPRRTAPATMPSHGTRLRRFAASLTTVTARMIDTAPRLSNPAPSPRTDTEAAKQSNEEPQMNADRRNYGPKLGTPVGVYRRFHRLRFRVFVAVYFGFGARTKDSGREPPARQSPDRARASP